MDENEQALEAELRTLFQRILELGRQQGERAAFARIIAMAQTAMHENRARTDGRAAGEIERAAQARNPLRPIQ